MKTLFRSIALTALLSIAAFAQIALLTTTMQNAATANGNGVAIVPSDMTTNAMFGAVGIQITGTFSATVNFEVTFDGTNWVPVMGTKLSDDSRATSTTSTGAYSILLNGALQARARISGYSSGSVTVVGRLIPGLISRAASSGGGGGSGTVTNFSAGDLSPLFTTSEANTTTTPALSFSLSNALAHKFFGNNTGSTGAPDFVSIGTGDLPSGIPYGNLNLTGAILNADLAGSIANAKLANSSITIAGNNTSLGGSITASTILDSIGSTRGTVLYRGVSGWAALTPGTSGQFLQTQGAGADPQWAAGGGITVGTTTITSGTSGRVPYNNAGVYGETTGFTSDGTNVTAGSGNLRATSPRFTTDVSDSNGNEVFKITATGSAVNEFTIANAATGASPTITASGGDTDVGLNFTGKGVGGFVFTSGVTTGTGATAGIRGLFNSLTTGNGVDISSSSATTGNLVSIASTSTAAASSTLTGLKVAMSGANGTSAQTVTGQSISVTNTNATSGTNIALSATASGATTANYAAVFTGLVAIGGTTVSQPALKNSSGTLQVRTANDAAFAAFTAKNISTGNDNVWMGQDYGGIAIGSTSYLGFANAAAAFNTVDISLVRVATNVLGVRNGSTGAGSLVLGTSTVGSIGTSGVGVLAIANGTAPTSSPADEFQLYSADSAAGDANLFARNEAGEINRLTGLTARVSTQFDKTSSTTLADVTGLTRNVEAGRTYSFIAVLYTTSNSAGGVKAAIGGTATATSVVYEAEVKDGSTFATMGTARATTLATAVGDVTAVTAAKITITGTIVVNAAGTLTVQFAQNASNGTASSVLINSSFQLIPIS